jgi:NAD(P)-dependent dehydrogenase (short-subunit alcohol dehydrogenase family)
MFDFSNQVVIITGAAGYLGQAVSEAFRSAGAQLVLVDRATDRLPALFPALVDSPRAFLASSIDLTDSTSVAHMVAETIDRFQRIDVLVNTAGGYRAGTPVHEIPATEWDFMLDLNFRTALNTGRSVVPHMLAQGHGKVINTAGRAGFEGSARGASYSVSKAAVLRLTESMAAELKLSKINVNAVVPGTIDTPANRASMPKADRGRWVKPAAIAEVVLFLASPAARAIHGAAVPVYGLG